MECEKCKLYKLDIDYKKLKDNIIPGNAETLFYLCNKEYGDDEDLVEEYSEPLLSHILAEKRIFFQETLRFLYQLDLMNVASFAEIEEIAPFGDLPVEGKIGFSEK